MNTDNCEKIQELLYDYADSSLDCGRAQEVREHLMHCKECSSVYEEIVKMKDAVGSSYETAPASLLPGVMDAVGRYEEKKRRRSFGYWFSRVGRYAAALLIITVGTAVSLPFIKNAVRQNNVDEYGGSGYNNAVDGGARPSDKEGNHLGGDHPTLGGIPGGSAPPSGDTSANTQENGNVEDSPPSSVEPLPDGSICCVYTIPGYTYPLYRECEGWVYFNRAEGILIIRYSEKNREYCDENASLADKDAAKDKTAQAEQILKDAAQYKDYNYILIVLE